VPLPLPLAPLVIEIHAALELALHAQPLGAVTITLPVAAAALYEALDAEIESVQTVTHTPLEQAEPLPHVPHEPPQPSEPQVWPVQLGVQVAMHTLPLQACPLAHVPHETV
jgi:hypothetical protein